MGNALMMFKRLTNTLDKGKIIKDKNGKIGYKIADCYLVAKKSPYGDIVSVHKKIWDKAREEKLPIIMYIQSAASFYKFEPIKIEEIVVNFRGDEEMINFGIREGINFNKFLDEKERAKTPEEKLKELSQLCL